MHLNLKLIFILFSTMVMAGYQFKGCFQLNQQQIQQQLLHVEYLSSIDSLQSCYRNCLLNSSLFFYLSLARSGGEEKSCSCVYGSNSSTSTTAGGSNATASTTTGGSNATAMRFLSSIPIDSCNAVCLSNQFPCGSSTNTSIVSVYDITLQDPITISDPNSVIGGTGQVNTNPSVTTVTVYNPSVDQSALQTRIAFYVAAGVAGLFLVCMLYYYAQRRRAVRSSPSLPRLQSFKGKGGGTASTSRSPSSPSPMKNLASPTSSLEKVAVSGGALLVNQRSDSLASLSSSSTTTSSTTPSSNTDSEKVEYLIPNLLPKIPSHIYNVCTVYHPVRSDEIELAENDVVQVLKIVQKAQWALGNNLSSGKRGVFPLVCLVDVDRNTSGSLVLPSRRM